MSTEFVGWRRLAGGIAGVACAAAAVVVILVATAAGGSTGGYSVRAIFDDAGNLIAGENVKIDGVKVGTVSSVTATPQAKAAVVLDIENPGFRDFRSDASCTIRPESLIGEKYVDCLPTQPRVEGTPLPPPLKRIPGGQEGAGEYLLPVQNTHSPVDVDLLGDIDRLPERERLTIILNELGAGLAGRGSDLNEVIKRANPALQELDKVLQILANENKVLAKLAVDGDKALKPIARDRERVGDFIVQANKVAQASAATRGSLKRNLELFPPFLEQLSPALERVRRFAEATTPTFADLKAAAPGLDKAFESLPAFSSSSEKFFTNLGSTAKLNGPALVGTKPLLKELQRLGDAGLPFTENFSQLFESLRETGGLERIMDFIFLGTGSANGYDALGHFLRAEGAANDCLSYYISSATSSGNCHRKLFNTHTGSSTASAASASKQSASAASALDSSDTSVLMARTLAVMNGATQAQAIAKYPGPETVEQEGAGTSAGGGGSPASAQPVGGTSAGTTYYTPPSASSPEGEGSGADGLLLNYLLGNE
ncbi:MAG TPA: MlaD family protein [Solirubrobacteraceae bacterium]|nr:MlaD family protein [Solirubrobacteraceae bacterium]